MKLLLLVVMVTGLRVSRAAVRAVQFVPGIVVLFH
jgi:hypothetical protein